MSYKSRIFITADTHRNFDEIEWFCDENNTTKNDIIIIAGDASINYFLDNSDDYIKKILARMPITFLILHGNHEERAWNIKNYQRNLYRIGDNDIIAWRENKYPNLLFLDDYGELLLNDKSYLFLGGAYSVDKYYRLKKGLKWFESEQIANEEREGILQHLETYTNLLYDFVISHTCPFKYIPTEAFIPQVNQNTVDNSMEHFLDKVEQIVTYNKWYCGHFHIDKVIDRTQFIGMETIIQLD